MVDKQALKTNKIRGAKKGIAKVSPERKLWQSELTRKLYRDAFHKLNRCKICGAKENLQIHHLLYVNGKDGFFNPLYYVILCEECHVEQHRIKNATKKDD